MDAAGADEPSLTTRRKKLALLAVLALAERPLPRATLLEMFWGDAPEERARHSLNDTVSHLRRVLGRDAVVTRQEEIALARPLLLAVDAIAFADAAAAGDHARALAIHAGPFLDGIHLRGSHSFEDWVARERSRLGALWLRSCEARVRALAGAGAWEECAEVARRWLDADPTSGTAGIHLLRALSAPETPAARRVALAAYDEWVARLAREDGRTPPAEAAALVRAIAAATGEMPVATAHSVVPSPMRSPTSGPAPATPAQPIPPSPSSPSTPTASSTSTASTASTAGRRRSAALRWSAAVAALGLVAAAVGLRRGAAGTTAGAPVVAGVAQRPGIAVVAASAAAGDSAAQWLGVGLPRMIGDALAHVPEIELIPAERLGAVIDSGAPLDPSRLAAAGRAAGATWIAASTVSRQGDTLRLDLSVLDARTGAVARTATLAATDPLTLADQAAARLLALADANAPGARLAELETSSVAAYQQLVRATALVTAGDERAAAQALDAALALDSGFVSALHLRYRLALQLGEYAVRKRLSHVLPRARSRMNERDRLEQQAWESFHGGEHERSEFFARTLMQRFPRDPRSYDVAMMVFGYHGRLAEVEAAAHGQLAMLGPGDSRMGCTRCGVYRALSGLYGAQGRWREADEASRRIVELQPQAAGAWDMRQYVLAQENRHDESLEAARRSLLLGADSALLQTSMGRTLLRARRFAAAESVIAVLRAGRGGDAAEGAVDLQVLLERERGQFRAARRTIAVWEAAHPDAHWIRLMNFDNLGRLGARAELARYALRPGHDWARTLADTSVMEGPGFKARGWVWHHAMEADAWARAGGDTLRLRIIADSLAAIGPLSSYGRDWRMVHHVRGLIARRAGRRAEAVRELEAALWGLNGWTRTNVELADAYRDVGRTDDALRILRAAYTAPLDAMGRYVPRSELDYRMARLFQSIGAADSAAVYAAWARAAWRAADPEVRRLLDSLPALP